ncbi:MAG: deoxyribose-phosphate aldolase [Aestuariibaculum sp.]
MDISKYIDYTLLSPTSTEHDIINLCINAVKNEYHAVCINSSHVSLAKKNLKDKSTKIATVVGFPLGATSTEAKIFEAKKAIENGAHEIEMVVNLGYLKSENYESVLQDIKAVKEIIKETPLKVIIEISELSKTEIVQCCEICLIAQAEYIKTSSGFSKKGATFSAIKIIKKTIKNKAKIIASGNIRDLKTAEKYIKAGVHRVSFEADNPLNEI